jgi:hypothetical protein
VRVWVDVDPDPWAKTDTGASGIIPLKKKTPSVVPNIRI